MAVAIAVPPVRDRLTRSEASFDPIRSDPIVRRRPPRHRARRLVAGGGLVAAGLDAIEVAPQDVQAVVAVDVLAEGQGQAEQLGVGGADVLDGLLEDVQELVEALVGQAGLGDQRLELGEGGRQPPGGRRRRASPAAATARPRRPVRAGAARRLLAGSRSRAACDSASRLRRPFSIAWTSCSWASATYAAQSVEKSWRNASM